MLASGGSRMIFADIPENLYSTTEVGTVVYSPPEILKHFSWDKFGVNLKVNKTAYDFSVDIYSLAVIFWEVSYGKRAFADETRDIQVNMFDHFTTFQKWRNLVKKLLYKAEFICSK